MKTEGKFRQKFQLSLSLTVYVSFSLTLSSSFFVGTEEAILSYH